MNAWTDLPAWLRLITSLLVIGIGVYVFLYVSARFGLGIAGFGLAMFILSEKSRSEKGGYNF